MVKNIFRMRISRLPAVPIFATALALLLLLAWQTGSAVYGERSENLQKLPRDAIEQETGEQETGEQETGEQKIVERQTIEQEIREIQQALGGSEVDKKFPPGKLPSQKLPQELTIGNQQSSFLDFPTTASPVSPAPSEQIVALRETARQMDSAAHRLETLDLYKQADSLRHLAQKLRQQARLLREQQLGKSS